MRKPRLRVEIQRAVNGEYFAKIVARNNKQSWTSGETYTTKQGVRRAIKSLV